MGQALFLTGGALATVDEPERVEAPEPLEDDDPLSDEDGSVLDEAPPDEDEDSPDEDEEPADAAAGASAFFSAGLSPLPAAGRLSFL